MKRKKAPAKKAVKRKLTKKKVVKKPVEKLTLKQLLFNQLIQLFEHVTADEFDDGSANWIEIQVNNELLFNIDFDETREEIVGVSLFKQIVEIVDHKLLHSTYRKPLNHVNETTQTTQTA